MMKGDGEETAWRTYEEVAEYLLNSLAHELGLERVEGNNKVAGRSTEWTIDAKGIKIGDEGFVIVEAKRYLRARLDQEIIGGLAFRIRDTGAIGGIIVSPLPLQEGAQKVANQKGIIHVTFAADSTPHEFRLSFLVRYSSVCRTRSGFRARCRRELLAAHVTPASTTSVFATCACECHGAAADQGIVTCDDSAPRRCQGLSGRKAAECPPPSGQCDGFCVPVLNSRGAGRCGVSW
jgi:hypothetical protein